ncbi:hypothetical protein DFQ26_002398 [Actinomortierella ambigua]|nr:hypothetical protein DFQ26_002398 [Actinomortierella ambigua]
MFPPAKLNDLALKFRALHEPGNPLVVTNVYDAATAGIVCSIPTVKAVATASYAIAAVQGVEDNDMTKAQNLAAIQTIARVVVGTGAQPNPIPMTADMQDGYDDVADSIRQLLALGVVGCNIEDVDNTTGKLRSLEEATARIRLAVETAKEMGVPAFAVNARTDVLAYEGGTIEEAIARGKAFLAAGANTVFVWGGPRGRGLSSAEVRQLVQALDGRLNVIMKQGEGFLKVPEIRQLGVARISMGPGLYFAAMNAYRTAAEAVLSL